MSDFARNLRATRPVPAEPPAARRRRRTWPWEAIVAGAIALVSGLAYATGLTAKVANALGRFEARLEGVEKGQVEIKDELKEMRSRHTVAKP